MKKLSIKIDIDSCEIFRRRKLLSDYEKFCNNRMPVWLFVDLPFHCKVAEIAIEQTYNDHMAMLWCQLLGWKKVLEEICCDNTEPTIVIDFGSPLTASTYGCEVVERPNELPQFFPWFRGEQDLDRLKSIDPLDTPLRRRELQFFEAYRAMAESVEILFNGGESVLPLTKISLATYSEGPFSIACMIAGMDNVAMWALCQPDLVQAMLNVITCKEIDRIKRQFQIMGRAEAELTLADDFSPYMSEQIYRDLILPSQIRLRDSFGSHVNFHSCIADRRLLGFWKNDLRIRHFNGFKPQGGFSAIERDFQPVAELMGGSITMEPDIDGINTLVATKDELGNAAMVVQRVFSLCKGVKLCATISGGHDVNDLEKFNALMNTL